MGVGASPSARANARSTSDRPERKVKRRKYNKDYIRFGFFWTGEEDCPKPHCVLCYESLANESMKPAKLRRHLDTKHKDCNGKPIEFFKRKRDELQTHTTKAPLQFFLPGENAKATEASYKVSLMIAKTGKAHSIGEALVKPAAKIMADTMLGKKARDELNKVPLSNDTVKRRIDCMANNVEEQLLIC